MATGNLTTTTQAVFLPEVWDSGVQEAFHNNLVMAGRVKRFDDLVSGMGDTIHVPKVAERSARSKSGGSAITYDTNTENEFTMSIATQKYSAYILEDIARIQSKASLRDVYTKESGRSVAEGMDDDLIALYSGLSNSVSGGTALDDTDTLSGVATLDGNNVPSSDRHYVVHSEGIEDLRAVNKFTEYDKTGQTGVAVTDGTIAKVYGTEVVMSNNITISSGTPDLVHNLMFHRECFALALQAGPTTKTEDSVDHIGLKFVVHSIYGVGEYRDEAGVDIQLNS